MNFVERTYKENGVEVTKLKTVCRPLSIRQDGYINIIEIPVNRSALSWKQANEVKRLEKLNKSGGVDENK